MRVVRRLGLLPHDDPRRAAALRHFLGFDTPTRTRYEVWWEHRHSADIVDITARHDDPGYPTLEVAVPGVIWSGAKHDGGALRRWLTLHPDGLPEAAPERLAIGGVHPVSRGCAEELNTIPQYQETPMFQTTVTITRDDILQGEEWLCEKLLASLPTPPEPVEVGSQYFDGPEQRHLRFTVEAIRPDGRSVIVRYADGSRTEEVALSTLQDYVLSGEVQE